MARKPLLLGMLLIALAVAVWFITRLTSGERGAALAPTDERSTTSTATGAEIALPPATAAETRSSTPSEPSAAAPPIPEETASAFFLRGKVVDSRRFGAAGVEVRILRADSATASVTSDERGQFVFAIPVRAEKYEGVSIWALRGEETAIKSLSLPGRKLPAPTGFLDVDGHAGALGDVDAGVLALRPARTIHVSVSDSGHAAANADVRIWLGVETTVLWHGKTDAEGMVTSPPLPAGITNVEAMLGQADGCVRLFLPDETEAKIDLAPRFEATITIVEKQGGTPIPNADVQLSEFVWVPSSPDDSKGMGFGEYVTSRPLAGGKRSTDAEGIARFPDLAPGGDYDVRVNARGFESYPPQGSGGDRISLRKPALRFELGRIPARTVHWPIQAGEVPSPPEGASIALRPAPGSSRDRFSDAPAPQREGVVHGAEVVVDGIEARGFFLGTAPDGSIAQFTVDEKGDVGRPVSFRRPRTIEVSVRDGAGAPVADARTQARNQGNNPLGSSARTDVEGLAKLTDLYGELANVYVLGPSPGARETVAGTVNLKTGGGRVEAVLQSSATMRARLEVHVDGVAQLPPEYRLSNGAVLEEIPERGELVVSLTLPAKGDEVSLSLSSMGFQPLKLTLPIVRDGSEPRLVADLLRSATLTARVTMPRNKDRPEIQIQSWADSKQSWGAVMPYFNGLNTPNAPGGSFRFYQLAAGRYRVIDGNSQVASEAVEIVEGQLEAQVVLDLDGIEWVTGRVELPDVAELSRVRVLATTETPSSNTAWLPGLTPPEGAYISPDGTFRTRVKRGVKTHLRVWHPWLAPAEPGGTLDVDAGREGVVLKLVAGDEVRIAVPQLVELRGFNAARVALYDGPVNGEPRAWLHAPLIEGVLRFTNVPRGRATLWIDAGRDYAPLVLANVEIAAGVTDLGVASFSRGSSLRIKLAVKEGESAPRIYIFARREVAPALNRELNSSGTAEVVLSGIEAGVYAVSYHSIMGSGRQTERQIEFDGVNDVEIPLDLR